MNCLRCGFKNQDSNRCGSCGAALPRNFGQTSPAKSIELVEGKSYDPPTKTYANRYLDDLEAAIDDWLEGQGEGDEMEQALAQMRNSLADLVGDLDIALGAIQAQMIDDPDDLPHQIGYLLQTGVARFGDALEALDLALSEENEDKIDALLDELRLSNDYICHSSSLIGQLFAREGTQIRVAETEDVETDLG